MIINNLLTKIVIVYIVLGNLLLIAADTNKIMAVINSNIPIFNYEVKNKQAILQITGADITENQALDQIILNYLLIEAAKTFGISMSESEFEITLDNYLKENKITLSKLVELSEKKGVNRFNLLKNLQEEFLVEKIKQILIFNLPKTSEQEIDMEINRLLALNNTLEFELKQISIPNEQNAERLINDIYAQLLKGASFNKLAQLHSKDYYEINNGDIGFIPANSLPTEVLDEIKFLKYNQFTKPIFIDNSYKIYYLVQSRPLLTLNPKDPSQIDQLRSYSKQKIVYEKGQVLLEEFIQELIFNTTIVYY